ncbi:hypothetical protein GCM10007301_56110 [Azorhizobium oxalatiphilum]|uniref:Serine protease n=1 Tax=Azorhizobium oxalatiphilum TaxID=980631 RepID=A0A917FM23_9HYPH|nr:serine protease [Azorhizobium oxalatiphilum]GGF88979.1 hypothetical protein GCM10007301_56110 [Azorhizobium oxalatiphilum]
MLAAGVTLLFASGAHAEIPFAMDKPVGKSGGWSIGISVAMGGCMAEASYDDQTTVWIGFSGPKDTPFFVLANAKWRALQAGKAYDIRLMPRGQEEWTGSFTGLEVGERRGLVSRQVKDDFIMDFARANMLDVVYDQKIIAQLSLSGSRAALERVINCQKDLATALRDPPPVSAKQDKMPPAAAPAKPAAPSQPPKVAAREPVAKEPSSKDPALLPQDKETDLSGTGFAVSERGHILTNHHVINGCRRITVTRVGEPPVPAVLIASDARNDLALLQTGAPIRTVPPLKLRARVGDGVFVYGFPLSGILASNGNFTAGNVTASAGLADDTRMLQISAPVQPGNSGGPLLDQNAEIVGVVVSKLDALKLASVTNDVAQNVNFAIKSTIAANFLETNGIEAKVQGSSSWSLGERLDPAAVAEQAKKFTFRIDCH